MREKVFFGTTLFICLAIAGGFLIMGNISNRQYNDMILENIEQISELVTDNLEQTINNLLTEEIQLAQSISNNVFLASWLEQNDDLSTREQLVSYLEQCQQQLDNERIKIISLKDGVSVQQNGEIQKEEIEQTEWYQQLVLERKKQYMYVSSVNSQIEDTELLFYYPICNNDEVIAVLELRTNLDYFEDVILYYQKKYDTQVYFLGSDGQEKFKLNQEETGIKNIFREHDLKDAGMSDYTYWEKERNRFYANNDIFYRVVYVEGFDCYIVISKSGLILQQEYQHIVFSEVMYMILCIIIVLGVSITLLTSYHRKIIRIENIDYLTKLYNRKYFQDLYKKQLKHYKECYLILLDIDEFKSINDTYGHSVGDEALRFVSGVMRDVVGRKGILCRWGGDEFIGIIYGTSDETMTVMNHIVTKVYATEFYMECKVSISLGGTKIQKEKELKEIIEKADKALYSVKENGRNGIQIIE